MLGVLYGAGAGATLGFFLVHLIRTPGSLRQMVGLLDWNEEGRLAPVELSAKQVAKNLAFGLSVDLVCILLWPLYWLVFVLTSLIFSR